MLPRSRTLPSRIHDNVSGDTREASSRVYFEVQSQPKPHEDVEAINPRPGFSKCFDDDGRLKRTGTVWTASSHVITAVIGSGVLSLAWAIGQLGWVAGPAVMILFAVVIYYTSNLLSDCYRTGDPITGKRNYTYMEAVRANLGGTKVKVCGAIQYVNLVGVAIGYTIAASISMMAIKRSNCFHTHGDNDPCKTSSNTYMIIFGITEVLFSQIPDFDQVWWLSIVAAVMSFTYSTIGLSLGVAKVAGIILLSNCEQQVYCQPLFAFVEKWSAQRWPKSEFIIHEYEVVIPFTGSVYKLNLFRLVWRTAFVIVTTVISMLLPFFNDVVGILGAFGFWPLTVYFPVEMYIAQKKIKKGTARWVGLQLLSYTCLVVSLAAACGSVAGVLLDLKSYHPFKSTT